MRETTDALGKGIDPGIFDTVVALNALDIPTVASCEGHLERALAAPWIDVEPPEVLTLRQQLRELQDQEGVHRAPGATYTPSDGVGRLRRQIKEQQLDARLKLMALLDAFYRERLVSYDRRLIISNRDWLGRSRIECQGTDFQELAEPPLRQQKLAEYQGEMQAFAAFLKTVYSSLGGQG
jgi:hypothetical protein